MAADTVQQFVTRARDFFNGMRLLRDDLGSYKSSSALLGIHSAISYSDALRTAMGCDNLASDDHRSAVRDLKSRLASKKFEKAQGATHLEKILAHKNGIAYDAILPRESEIEEVLKQVERFAFWAEETAKQLRMEGW